MISRRLMARLAPAIVSIASLAAFTTAAQAQTDPPITLGSLLGVDEAHALVVGDKEFYGFTYQGEPAQASDITITTLSSPQIGLQFNFTWTSTNASKVDSVIGYFVHTRDTIPQFFINGVGLNFNGTTTSANNAATNAAVTETVYAADQQTQLGQLSVIDFGPGNANNKDSDFLSINPAARTLFVRKDIQADSAGGGTATISFVDNSFSQTPEPASIALLAVGAGAIMLRRRRVV